MLAGGSVCPGERKESFVIESKNRKVWRWHERGLQVRMKGSWSGRKWQWQNYCQFCIWQEASIFRANKDDVVLSGFSKNKSCSVILNLLKMWQLFKSRQYTVAVVRSTKDEERDELNSDIFCQVQSRGNTLPEFMICSPKNRGNMAHRRRQDMYWKGRRSMPKFCNHKQPMKAIHLSDFTDLRQETPGSGKENYSLITA